MTQLRNQTKLNFTDLLIMLSQNAYLLLVRSGEIIFRFIIVFQILILVIVEVHDKSLYCTNHFKYTLRILHNYI